MFITAAIALDAQKAVFEQSALEIVIELLAYKSREISTIGLQGVPISRKVATCFTVAQAVDLALHAAYESASRAAKAKRRITA